MTFKAQLAADISGVFLSSEEFGGMVMFQGNEISAVVAKDSAEALDEWRRRVQEPPGVGVQLLTLYVAAADVAPLYPEDEVTLDGIRWSVLSTADDAGLLAIHLYRHES